MNHRSLTHFPRQQGRPGAARTARALLTLALALMLGLASPLGLVSSAQTSPDAAGRKKPSILTAEADDVAAFVVYGANGQTSCREATPAERREILRVDPSLKLRQINHLADVSRAMSSSAPAKGGATAGSGTSNAEAAAGLRIILRASPQLQTNPAAMAAFTNAAAAWEALITSDVTVVIDVDYGTTRFGTAWSSNNILGSTSSGVRFVPPYTDVRARLIDRASSAEESGLYNSLPPGQVATDRGVTSNMIIVSPIARALGAIEPHANPAPTPPPPGGQESIDAFGRAPQIGFNSNHNFDLNPADGIDTGFTDFNAVAIHEIGHALGFTSEVGAQELSPSSTLRLSLWDLFRFRPSTAQGAFNSAPRILTSGGEHVHFDGAPELRLSTGKPDGTGGDGEQSSHWKADERTGVFIGIMDPTIAPGEREEMSNNDRRAINFFGYQVGAGPAPPANDDFANAIVLQGPAGTTTGTNSGATLQAGEPEHTDSAGGRSVWYRWVAPGTGNATIDTRGSNFDTILSVYIGGALNALGVVASNDDIVLGQDTDSTVTFPVTAGTTYQIRIDGFDGDFGSFLLNWSGPAATTPTPTPTPAPTTFNISGRVQDGSGAGVGGIRVGIDGPSVPPMNLPHLPVTTDVNGNFAFNGMPAGGNYTLTPFDDSRFTFSPLSISVQNLIANQNVTFTATLRTVNVGARVTENGAGLVGVTMTLFQGNLERAATTTDAAGNYQFNNLPLNDSFQLVPSKAGYGFSPASLNFLANGAPLGDMAAFRVGSINDPAFFVRQHYLDFLGRQPDQSGLNFWGNQISSCGPNVGCTEVRRINVSAAFFLSIELQETGYFVYRLHKAAFGNKPNKPVPITRAEFLADSQQISTTPAQVIVNTTGWEQQLETNKQTFVFAFVNRPAFAALAALSPLDFVNALNTNTGNSLTQPEVDALVAELTANNTLAGRAAVLRAVAQNAEFGRRQKSPAFVLMQYFGYLRRDPDAAPNSDFSGYEFWLRKLNNHGGDYISAEMVKAFILSSEYLGRFPTP